MGTVHTNSTPNSTRDSPWRCVFFGINKQD
uniref:Uncharacterized protein n=1 Tax=Arundo donax TaxID=35708 RepID=A0A0A9GPT2_ARUDO